MDKFRSSVFFGFFRSFWFLGFFDFEVKKLESLETEILISIYTRKEIANFSNCIERIKREVGKRGRSRGSRLLSYRGYGSDRPRWPRRLVGPTVHTVIGRHYWQCECFHCGI
jgi:hypothetical protein